MDETRRDIIAVNPALLKEFLLDDLHARTQALFAQALPGDVEQRLAGAPEPGDTDVARAGYLTRVAEVERFEPARQPMPWLVQLLDASGNDVAAVARDLARSEPLGKPAPSDLAANTWQVPGPGGHVRYFLAARWTGGDEDRRQSWLYGFFLRCCEEALGS